MFRYMKAYIILFYIQRLIKVCPIRRWSLRDAKTTIGCVCADCTGVLREPCDQVGKGEVDSGCQPSVSTLPHSGQ
jgi:hypothetical protein